MRTKTCKSKTKIIYPGRIYPGSVYPRKMLRKSIKRDNVCFKCKKLIDDERVVCDIIDQTGEEKEFMFCTKKCMNGFKSEYSTTIEEEPKEQEVVKKQTSRR